MLSVIQIDPATAADLVSALRNLEGRLRGSGRGLSPGARELLRVAERSGAVRSGQPRADPAVAAEDASMVLELLPLPEVADRLHVSDRTLRRYTKGELQPQLPTVRVGSSVRVRPQDLAKFIDDLPAARETA